MSSHACKMFPWVFPARRRAHSSPVFTRFYFVVELLIPVTLFLERRCSMHRSRNLTLVLAVAAGFLGGFLSRYISVPSVHAQGQPPYTTEVRSQSFTIVDNKGRVLGTFTASVEREPAFPPNRLTLPQIVLVDPRGRELWSAGGRGFKPLAENSR
jgi:hypothetical protein